MRVGYARVSTDDQNLDRQRAALAELEREQTRERQRGGIEAAKRAGRHLGRPPKLSGAQIREAEKMLLDDRPASEVARLFRVHPKTLKAATRR
jgi:putative DNA-invertase from lambdoid prophage Rac